MSASKYVEFFGPSAWKFLHAVSFTFPENPTQEEQRAYEEFFSRVGDVLPCPTCRGHYKEYLDKNPIRLESRAALAKYVYELHSDVNRRTKKPNLSFEQVATHYGTWTPAQNAELSLMTPQERRLALGSPFIDPGTSFFSSRAIDLVLILLVFALLSFLLYVLYVKYFNKKK
jgi:hypothetical protein